jgi:hypothetical protein
LGEEEVGGGWDKGGGGDGWVAPGAAVDVEDPGSSSSFFFFFSCWVGGWVWSGWGGRGGEPDGEGLQGQGGLLLLLAGR